jgi:hypothetical protein
LRWRSNSQPTNGACRALPLQASTMTRHPPTAARLHPGPRLLFSGGWASSSNQPAAICQQRARRRSRWTFQPGIADADESSAVLSSADLPISVISTAAKSIRSIIQNPGLKRWLSQATRSSRSGRMPRSPHSRRAIQRLAPIFKRLEKSRPLSPSVALARADESARQRERRPSANADNPRAPRPAAKGAPSRSVSFPKRVQASRNERLCVAAA